jgi:hypothetical protein
MVQGHLQSGASEIENLDDAINVPDLVDDRCLRPLVPDVQIYARSFTAYEAGVRHHLPAREKSCLFCALQPSPDRLFVDSDPSGYRRICDSHVPLR